ncbi:MAG: hypothetical protein ABI690_16740 [Chloroflexota bacterium]
MTQTTFTDNVLVDGSQDIKQLRVQGHTTQTLPVQTWEDSAGSTLAQLTGDGRFIIGDDVTPDSLVEAHRLETSTSKPKRGIHSLGKITNTVLDVITWAVAELELLGSAGVSGLQTALRAKATHNNTGTSTSAEVRAGDFQSINQTGLSGSRVGQVTGVRATASNTPSALNAYLAKAVGVEAAITNASGGDVTDAVAIDVVPPVNAGMIANLYGLRIPDLTQGGAANVALQTGLGKVSFGDFMDVKRPSVVPGTPATDFMRLYPKSDGKLYAKDWNGKEYEVTIGSIPNGRKSWRINAAAATVDAVGIAAPTVTGATASNDVDSTYINFATTAVIGNIAGLISATFNLVRPGYDPTFIAVIRTGADITNLRLFVGLFATAPTNADNPPNNSICFRYSAPAADGGWRGVSRDAAAQTVSAQIGSNLAANTKYTLKFRKQGSTVYFSVDNGAETAISTNLPADATDLGVGVRVIATAAAIKNLKLSRLHCDFN